jgi:YVTN family beta-propeller protein
MKFLLYFFISLVILTPVVYATTTVPIDTGALYSIRGYNNDLYIQTAQSEVQVIDTSTNTKITEIPNVTGGTDAAIVGSKIYVASSTFPSNKLSVGDMSNNSFVTALTITGPNYIVVSGTKLYIFGSTSTVTVVDTNTDTIVGSITLPEVNTSRPAQMGDKIYVLLSTKEVSVIDTKTDAIETTFLPDNITNNAHAIYVFGTKLFVIVQESYPSLAKKIFIYDTTNNNQYINTITGLDASGGIFSRMNNGIYVTKDSNTIIRIDHETDTVAATITGVSSQGRPSTLFQDKIIINDNDNYKIFDTATDTVTDSISLAGGLSYAATMIDDTIYVAEYVNGVLFVTPFDELESQLPALTSFSSTTSDGVYIKDQPVDISAHFNRPIQNGSTMTIKLSTGASVVLNQVSGSTLSGTYIVGAGQQTPDLAVTQIQSASVTDSTGTYTRTSYRIPSSVGDFEGENSFITRNLADAHNIQIGAAYETIDVGNNPYQLSGNINGAMYVLNQGSNTVSVIDVATGSLIDTINVGGEPYGLTVVGTKLYIANTLTNNVSVIDTTTNTVVQTINVGIKPYYVANVGTKVYVTNGASNTVSVIESTTDTVIGTISVGSYPRGIKAYGNYLYVANYGDPNYSGGNYVSVIDSGTDTVVDTVILPATVDGPRGVNVLGGKVYVTGFRSNNVAVINPTTNTVTNVIDVGAGPRGIAGTGTTLYVENFDDGSISVVNTAINTVEKTIQVGSSPSGITIVGDEAYITSFQDNKIYKISTLTNELASAAFNEQEDEVDTIDQDVQQVTLSGSIAPTPKPAIPSDCLETYIFSPSTGVRCPVQNNINQQVLTQQQPSNTRPQISRLLRIGARGRDVLELQKYLNTQGFEVAVTGVGSAGKETGYFGPKTKAAVIRFQRAKNLTPDGIVGLYTRKAF